MFFIGNVRDLTSNQLWLRAQQWYREYGEDSYLIWWYNWLTLSFFFIGSVVYLHVFGQGLVFLNTSEAAVDLLEKRGAIYSDKPALVMAGEL